MSRQLLKSENSLLQCMWHPILWWYIIWSWLQMLVLFLRNFPYIFTFFFFDHHPFFLTRSSYSFQVHICSSWIFSTFCTLGLSLLIILPADCQSNYLAGSFFPFPQSSVSIGFYYIHNFEFWFLDTFLELELCLIIESNGHVY